MRKHIKHMISTAAVLLLMLLILPTAFADVTYPAPGDIEAGSRLDHLVATVSADSRVSASEGTLPAGITLETETGAAGLNIYLRGTTTAVGSYNCVINVNDAHSLICPINVVPAKPSVSTSPDVQCSTNDAVQIHVSASVGDGGTLSYQWYSSTVNNVTSGTELHGATLSSLLVDTSDPGIFYYYCIVTNTNGGCTSMSISHTVAVTVKDTAVSAISVDTMPTQRDYVLGDTLNLTGLRIKVELENGDSRIITDGFSASPLELNRIGTQTIEIGYMGKSCSFTVNVEAADETVEGIGVLTLPVKTEYTVGDTLDPAGLSIRVYTNSGHRDVSQELDCSPTVLDQAGTQTITVSYGGRTCSFSVQVKAEDKPVSLSVKTMPDKRTYSVGDTLDPTGLVLKLSSSSGKSEELREGFTCSPTRLDKAGRQEITVSYGELSCRFSVTVEEKAAEASPEPVASPETQPSASPETENVSRPSHKGGISNALLTVIIIVALLALAALGAYVFIMNRGGFAQFKRWLEERFGSKK